MRSRQRLKGRSVRNCINPTVPWTSNHLFQSDPLARTQGQRTTSSVLTWSSSYAASRNPTMLRAIVSLSRKISRDYNSTGYSVTLDGEIPFTPDESEAVQEKISELFHLAE